MHVRPLTVVRSPRARAMRLAVDPRNGAVRLTLPRRASLTEALRWTETKRGWVEGQLSGLPQPRPIKAGMRFLFAGREVRLDWTLAHRRKPSFDGNALHIGGPAETLNVRLMRWLKSEARSTLDAETRELAARIGSHVEKVGVGDPVSRWGSCSASGHVRYSWRLILAPDYVRRATVAHEVAHLVHLNHGPRFHALVQELLGQNPAPARAWLRAHGASLHWFGRER